MIWDRFKVGTKKQNKCIVVYRDDEAGEEELCENFDPQIYTLYMSTDGTLLILLKKQYKQGRRIIKKAFAKGSWSRAEDLSV